MSRPYVNPDLQKERDGAKFDRELLTYELYGGEERTKRRRAIENQALADLKTLNTKDYHFMSRPEQYEDSMNRCVYYMKKVRDGHFKSIEDSGFYRLQFFPNEAPPIALQHSMFLPTLEGQTSPEQKQKWLQDALDYKILGTYAQTELGHGTHVRGLETTATYDPKTEEFIIHSPTLTSIKWWPGALGKTTNHCIVMANLISNGKSHGIHPFLVQTRCLDTHQPLPGITIGDIGPKFGYDTIDNGYLKLEQFRIPRENMLMKYARVEKDGTFVRQSKNSRLNYGVMVQVRAGITQFVAAAGLAQTCTIAIRYSCVRRQSELQPGGVEPQVLDFQTQQQKLFPWLASAYAYWFAGESMLRQHQTITAQIEKGDVEALPELHALSSGLKSFSTAGAAIGMEACRLACGGHGYSQSSGLPKIYTHNVPGCTYEGENTVLYLQTARYLLKSSLAVKKRQQLPPSVRYLTEKLPSKSSVCAAMKPQCLINAFKYRALRLINKADKRTTQLASTGKPQHEAWNLSSVYWVQAAEAHIELFVVMNFAERVAKLINPGVQQALSHLFQLYAANAILKNGSDYLSEGFMSSQQIDLLSDVSLKLLAEIRPNAVALVDAFDFTDRTLGSVLGRYDGDVYENLFKWAKSSPLNEKEVHDAYYKYLRPLIVGEKSKL